nr:cell division cycle protein 16 homolog isoform X2 [Bombyx mori]
MWLLASAMLARGELHRAAEVVTSRNLHKRHLLCLGVAMRAHLAAKESSTALNLLEDCDPMLLEPRNTDQTHNRALAGVLVTQARALSALERREAAAEALTAALRADCACYEALDLLLEQHALTPRQESELIESLPISEQLSGAEGALLLSAYRERFHRYSPAPVAPPPPDSDDPIVREAEGVRSRTLEAAVCGARRLAAGCRWGAALERLGAAGGGPGSGAALRAACLLELRRAPELFAFAHGLVDAYPTHWTAWYAVGCYYYLIGKNELARRYLSKSKSLEPGAGCVWLAYGHSFAADNEHDQAMAAYFKASQLMGGCHLPPLYVGVECSLLNNVAMCERFLYKAAVLHRGATEAGSAVDEGDVENKSGWDRILGLVSDPHVAHEAGAAALAAGDPGAARLLWLRTLDVAAHDGQLNVRWAATLDGLGHASRALGGAAEGLQWHERALGLRPRRGASHTARGLCLALLGRAAAAADALHGALALDPDDVVALALLDLVVDTLDRHLAEEEIPQFPFPAVNISLPAAPATPLASVDVTNTSDMSMSFD